MFKRTLFTLLISAGLILGACGPVPATSAPATTEPVITSQSPSTSEPAPTSPPPSPAEGSLVLASDHPRNTTPSAPAADVSQLANDNAAFAMALYQALQANNNNLIVSPYSISQALAMTYAGARGDTEKQMAATLHFTLRQPSLHPAFNALDLALMKPAATQEGQGTPFQLNIANAIWGQKDYAFLLDFLNVLAENYGAGLRLADFVNAPDPARLVINQWVSDQTQNKINDLLPSGSVTPDTRLILTNAVYFKAGWQYTFEPSLTQNGDFKVLDGSTVSVPFMHWSEPEGVDYVKGANYQAVSLPYIGGKQSMLILIPEAGQFSDFQKALSAESLQQIENSLVGNQVELSLPKFTFSTDTPLGDTLAALGMPDAFKAGVADFSGMDGSDKLFISAVLHKAFVGVDEEGTEAAAATAVVVGTMAMPISEIQLTVDRPFIFLIRDNDTGAILFMGQVLNPQS
jgi:serpin B